MVTFMLYMYIFLRMIWSQVFIHLKNNVQNKTRKCRQIFFLQILICKEMVFFGFFFFLQFVFIYLSLSDTHSWYINIIHEILIMNVPWYFKSVFQNLEWIRECAPINTCTVFCIAFIDIHALKICLEALVLCKYLCITG